MKVCLFAVLCAVLCSPMARADTFKFTCAAYYGSPSVRSVKKTITIEDSEAYQNGSAKSAEERWKNAKAIVSDGGQTFKMVVSANPMLALMGSPVFIVEILYYKSGATPSAVGRAEIPLASLETFSANGEPEAKAACKMTDFIVKENKGSNEGLGKEKSAGGKIPT